MKRRLLLSTSFLLILLSFSTISQVNGIISTVSFTDSITIGATFEWVVKKYDIIQRPVPEAYTTFKQDDIIKIEIIANPPTLAEYWGFIPDVNITDWVKYYINDVFYNTSEDDFEPTIFMFVFIYPISISGCTPPEGFFEHYVDVVEEYYYYNLIANVRTKLNKDYFEVIDDQTADVYINSMYISRKYNIHTGLLSEFKHEFNNHEDNHYEIEIVNPDDSRVSLIIVFPVVSLLALSILFKRKKKLESPSWFFPSKKEI